MERIFINKYLDSTKDLTYDLSNRDDLAYYTILDIEKE